jgi:hypothetical protein
MEKKYQDALDNILDTFSGVDGGAKFLYFKILMTNMSVKAKNGDAAAKEILENIARFSKLIDIAERLQQK